ncbi:MAG TPA: DUF4105 domain-containing protein [Chitinophagales bacterium]|nr:DUF4105 domain-containing protein [Chitinophagales bacterium]
MLLSLFIFHSQAQPQLSSQAYISLITCSPGKKLYEAFGHSALRVHDPVNKIDRTYNYGTFDFDQPGFYSNYAKGRPVFMLNVTPTLHFINSYVTENRSVFEDILNLSQQQKQRLYELLEENYEPENRNYLYDYLYDNCSTRIRDMLIKVLEEAVVFDSAHLRREYSFRELMDLYLKPQPWGDLAIDLALGSEIDAKARPYQYMFLPDFLQAAFQHAKISAGGSVIPLVKNSTVIFKAQPEEIQKSLFTPLNIFWLAFFLFLLKTVLDIRKKKFSAAPDLIFFLMTGITGILIAYIAFFSNHHARGNFNLLWALPTHALFALLLPFKRGKPVRFYFLIASVMAIIAFAGGICFFPQKMHGAVVPLILIIAMRGAVLFREMGSY